MLIIGFKSVGKLVQKGWTSSQATKNVAVSEDQHGDLLENPRFGRRSFLSLLRTIGLLLFVLLHVSWY